jgi:flagellar basal body-associated protein FliL
MIIFLTIVFLLVCINAAMMLVSLYSVNKKAKTTSKSIPETAIPKIYPLDLIPSQLNKAV